MRLFHVYSVKPGIKVTSAVQPSPDYVTVNVIKLYLNLHNPRKYPSMTMFITLHAIIHK